MAFSLSTIATFCERIFNEVFVRQDGASVMSDDAYPVLEAERTSAATNTVSTVAAFRHVTTGDMVDGFGSAIGFEIEDDAATENLIVTVQGVRDGADNSGKLVVNLRNAGTWAPVEYEFKLKGFLTPQSVINVSDPPTDAELDAEFGTPAALGAGFITTIDDNSGNTDFWIVATSDTSWWHVKMTKAV